MRKLTDMGSRDNKGIRRHADGSPCLEGTRRVPQDYVPCCKDFDYRTTRCAYDIRYEYSKEYDVWVILLVEAAGGGGIEISYCPHCGARLKGRTGSHLKY